MKLKRIQRSDSAGAALALAALAYAQPFGGMGPGLRARAWGRGIGRRTNIDPTRVVEHAARGSEVAARDYTGAGNHLAGVRRRGEAAGLRACKSTHAQMLVADGTAPERMGQRAS